MHSTHNDLVEYFYQQIPITKQSAVPIVTLTKPTTRLFIKGPIPLGWLQSANHLGGSTGIVAVSLWFYAGLSKSMKFKIDGKFDRLTGITRQTRQQSLERLQRAGLVKLSCKSGAYPEVEICNQDLPFA